MEARSSKSKCQQGVSLLGSQMATFVFTWPFLCMSLYEESPLLTRTLVILDENPPQQPHLTLITSLKTLFPSMVTFSGVGKWRISTMRLEGHNSVPQIIVTINNTFMIIKIKTFTNSSSQEH